VLELSFEGEVEVPTHPEERAPDIPFILADARHLRHTPIVGVDAVAIQTETVDTRAPPVGGANRFE
jgi:hypothetical protein